MEKLQVKLLHPDAKKPIKAHPEEDAGFDLYCVEEAFIPPHGREFIDTGIAIAVPKGYYGQIMTRSSIGKKGMRVHPGVIDSGYRGGISVLVFNLTEVPQFVSKGDRIAQLLVLPVPEIYVESVEELPESQRGVGGFGSTGK